MATCKDCLFFEVCANDNGNTVYHNYKRIVADVERRCANFKDKSKYVVQKHGRWLDNAIAFAEKCSICGKGVYWDDGNYHRYTYCPNCGAKMDGEA